MGICELQFRTRLQEHVRRRRESKIVSILSFPNEVTDHIFVLACPPPEFDACGYLGAERWQKRQRARRADLHTFSLVCKAWRPIAQAQIGKYVTLLSEKGASQYVASAISQRHPPAKLKICWSTDGKKAASKVVKRVKGAGLVTVEVKINYDDLNDWDIDDEGDDHDYSKPAALPNFKNPKIVLQLLKLVSLMPSVRFALPFDCAGPYAVSTLQFPPLGPSYQILDSFGPVFGRRGRSPKYDRAGEFLHACTDLEEFRDGFTAQPAIAAALPPSLKVFAWISQTYSGSQVELLSPLLENVPKLDALICFDQMTGISDLGKEGEEIREKCDAAGVSLYSDVW